MAEPADHQGTTSDDGQNEPKAKRVRPQGALRGRWWSPRVALCGAVVGTTAVVVAALFLRGEAPDVFLASSALTFITGLGSILPAPRNPWKLRLAPRRSARQGSHAVPPRLAEALTGAAPAALDDITDVIILHQVFPAWAVWLPDGRRQWIAVRPASGRPAGPDLPMIWVQSATAADLGVRMRAADAQLPPTTPPVT